MTRDTTLSAPEERFRNRLDRLGSDPRRDRLYEAFAITGLPHRRVEGWRWSDLRAALKTLPGSASEGAVEDVLSPVAGPVFRFSSAGLSTPDKRPAGITWTEDSTAMPIGGAEAMPMGALAAALSDTPPTLVVEVAGRQPAPLRLVFEGAGERYARVTFIVRSGAHLTVLESHLAEGGFSSVMIEYAVEDGATLERVVSQASARSAVQVVTARIGLNAGSSLRQVALAQGAALFRCETHVVHDREASSAIIDGAYVLASGRHADFTSHVRHSAEACTTRQTVKGAINAGAKGAFQGKFLVKAGAQKTDATMTHNALLLADGAEVNAKPELEIYADDVQCAHGNTCGAIDGDALFYMRQRGIPEAEARAMLTESFIAEGLANSPTPEIGERLLGAARQWLRAEA